MLIVLEGLDGAGKSTQIRRLQELFSHRGKSCHYLHFPRFDAPVFGELIARFLRGEFGAADCVDPYLVALLFAGDRADAATTIRQWLSVGDVVILDRYVYSNIAYQCAKLHSEEQRQQLKQWILDMEYGYYQLPRPDVSIFLDVPFAFTERKLTQVREGDDRDYLQGHNDIHESSLDLQHRVREVYLAAATYDDTFWVVDCSADDGAMATPETIFSRIKEALSAKLSMTLNE